MSHAQAVDTIGVYSAKRKLEHALGYLTLYHKKQLNEVVCR